MIENILRHIGKCLIAAGGLRRYAGRCKCFGVRGSTPASWECYISGLDVATLCASVSRRRPRQILEQFTGAPFSTKPYFAFRSPP